MPISFPFIMEKWFHFRTHDVQKKTTHVPDAPSQLQMGISRAMGQEIPNQIAINMPNAMGQKIPDQMGKKAPDQNCKKNLDHNRPFKGQGLKTLKGPAARIPSHSPIAQLSRTLA